MVSAIWPQGLASSTFFAIPRQKKATPRANFSLVIVRWASWSAISEKRMIGPATRSGNIDSKQKKSMKLRMARASPR